MPDCSSPPVSAASVGYTEASRGCKHLCRHCPVVPVYAGRFRIVQPGTVLEDVRRQVAGGAQHITFGDPDFLNGPRHAVDDRRVALREEFPGLTYDITVKIEHSVEAQADISGRLRDTGCLLRYHRRRVVRRSGARVTGQRAHPRLEVVEAIGLVRRAGLHVNPTFMPFTPWQTPQGYVEFLRTVVELDLVDHVAPVQYAIPPLGSRPGRGCWSCHRFGRSSATSMWRASCTPGHTPTRVWTRYSNRYFGPFSGAQDGEENRRTTFRRVWESGPRGVRCIGCSSDRSFRRLDRRPRCDGSLPHRAVVLLSRAHRGAVRSSLTGPVSGPLARRRPAERASVICSAVIWREREASHSVGRGITLILGDAYPPVGLPRDLSRVRDRWRTSPPA